MSTGIVFVGMLALVFGGFTFYKLVKQSKERGFSIWVEHMFVLLAFMAMVSVLLLSWLAMALVYVTFFVGFALMACWNWHRQYYRPLF